MWSNLFYFLFSCSNMLKIYDKLIINTIVLNVQKYFPLIFIFWKKKENIALFTHCPRGTEVTHSLTLFGPLAAPWSSLRVSERCLGCNMQFYNHILGYKL